MNDEPMTPLFIATNALHEVYETLLQSGFTEDQAIRMLGIMLAETNKRS